MATYYKYTPPNYNTDTGKWAVLATILFSDPNIPGTPQPYPGFDNFAFEITNISEAGIKSALQSFATKVETSVSPELLATAGVIYNLQGAAVPVNP